MKELLVAITFLCVCSSGIGLPGGVLPGGVLPGGILPGGGVLLTFFPKFDCLRRVL